MRKFVFYALSVLCIPFFLIGLCSFMLPVLLARGKVSGTTYEPFNSRLQWDLLGLRKDTAARALARGLPATNIVTRLVVFRLLTLICRISGYISPPLNFPAEDEKELSSMVAMRTEFFDRTMSGSIEDGDQVVILGAGWDTRAYGLLKDRDVETFEVDTQATQQVKLNALEKTGIEHSHVRFVACDFNQECWLEKLRSHGFDPDTKTFVLWEGVTMYLTEDAVGTTLDAVSSLPAGSRIAFDFLPAGWWTDSKLGHRAAQSITVTYGENFTFFLQDEEGAETALEALLNKHKLIAEERVIQHLKEDESVCFYGMVLASCVGESSTGD